MKRKICSTVLSSLLVLLSACGRSVDISTVPGVDVVEDESRKDDIESGENLVSDVVETVNESKDDSTVETLENETEVFVPEGDIEITEEQNQKMMDFCISLFQQNLQSDGIDNWMISPVSMMYAMGMVYQGADHETRDQLKQCFGMTDEEMNRVMYAYRNCDDLDHTQLHVANSLWYKEDEKFQILDSYVEDCRNWYQADVKKTSFDQATVTEVNEWVEHQTDGMIDRMLESVPEDMAFLLINALAFDANWQDPYKEFDVEQGVFTTIAGEEQDASYMNSVENCYYENEWMQGFSKRYENGSYYFAGFIPKDGKKLEECLEKLTGAEIYQMLSEPDHSKDVYAKLPKFKSAYGKEMTEILQGMGVQDAFSEENADFSRMQSENSSENAYIGSVLQKTFIEVDEEGTKAAAVTEVIGMTTTSMEKPKEIVEITLDQPFFYMIVDARYHVPIFMGVTEHMD